jgi:O-acetylhomoserine/O-acetylserine sulfhydrylase-like pyridoxal-dependent enzyme
MLKDRVPENIVSPDGVTVKRLSGLIGSYENRMERISENTLQLTERLEKLEGISKVHYPYSSDSKENYQKIERYP